VSGAHRDGAGPPLYRFDFSRIRATPSGSTWLQNALAVLEGPEAQQRMRTGNMRGTEAVVAMTDRVTLTVGEAIALCERAARAAGARPETATALAKSVVAAEAGGQDSVGLAHFIDYLEALDAGRMDGNAVPEITQPAPAVILSDARGGAAHPGFDTAFDAIVSAARTCGLAIFGQRNAFTCGALGYFAGRLAERGFLSLAVTNGPALIAGSGSTKPVYCTNPLAFAAPQAGGPPLLIDQSSSATAFVNIRKAAHAGQTIPAGWALDSEGKPTTDARAAVNGALLAFGGSRGANIALMVEVLSAGLTGANWSLDAPSFTRGSKSPGTGLFVLAIEPAVFGGDFEGRTRAQMERLAGLGVHIPGLGKAEARMRAAHEGMAIPAAIHARIAGWAASRRG
jgi:(2R)-3-sulfolactate dehydrogenase (NADP+)